MGPKSTSPAFASPPPTTTRSRPSTPSTLLIPTPSTSPARAQISTHSSSPRPAASATALGVNLSSEFPTISRRMGARPPRRGRAAAATTAGPEAYTSTQPAPPQPQEGPWGS